MANIYQRYQETFNTISNNELNLSNNCRRFVQMFPHRNVFQFQSKLRRRNVSMFQPRLVRMFQSLPMFQFHKNSASENQGNKGGRLNVTSFSVNYLLDVLCNQKENFLNISPSPSKFEVLIFCKKFNSRFIYHIR